MDFKSKIISDLETMRKKETQDKQPFKARAYAKVINELKAHQGTITKIEDIDGIPGIGEKIRAKIKEIMESGELLAAKVVREERQFNILEELLNIHGIGPVKSRELVSKYAIKSIDDLRQKLQKDPNILNDVQTLGLKYYEDIRERIPRKEMVEHEKLLMKTIREVSGEFDAMVVGSYRRELVNSGDIDVILKLPKTMSSKVTGDLFKELVNTMKENGYILDILAKGAKKCMAVVRLANGKARRLDLLLTPEEEYGYALLYFTGSGPFNVVMRQYALERGYSMNEHRIKLVPNFQPEPKPVPELLTEKDIFDFLKVPYIKPTDRTPEAFEKAIRKVAKASEAVPVAPAAPAIEVVAPVPKKRGRPKKIVPVKPEEVEKINIIPVVPEAMAAPAPKKRGRPKKNP
jgi:DNA polymerase/3'-5' exonuclease PolX